MRPTRREFLWTVGAAASSAVALQEAQDVFWAPEEQPDLGWSPGIEEHPVSTCMVCPSRCGIRCRIVDGRLVRVTGSRLHPLSRGGLCPRGIAGVQMLYHPERLAGPLTRVGSRGGGEWQQTSRDGAVALLSERLRGLRTEGRPEALALLAGYCAGSMQDLWRQFLASFGSPNYVTDAYDDGTDAVMALMHGIPRRPSYDLGRTELVLSFGAHLFESWWSPLQAFVAFANPDARNGQRPRFIQVDTRFSRTAARAREWIGIHPETYATLALGMAYVMIRDELIDAQFVAEHVSGFEDFTDAAGRAHEGFRSRVIRNHRTEEVSAATGVPVERITAVARAFAASGRAVAICGGDVMHAEGGLLAGMAVHSLNVLTGNVNRAGGVLFGDDPPLAPLREPALDATARSGLERRPVADPAPYGAGAAATRFADAVARGSATPEALLLYYANPLASSEHPEAWRAALAKIPFVVSFSPFLDETSRHADLIIPDLLPFERWQDAPAPTSYPYRVWGVARPVVDAHEGGIATGDAVLALASELGGTVAESLSFDSFEALLRARAQGLFAARRGRTFGDAFEREHHRQMEERGWWLPEHAEFEPFWEELVERGGWADLVYDETDPARLVRTPSGRIELLPAELLRALEEQGQIHAPYLDIAREETEAPSEFPLRLIPYRVSTLASGTLSLERWLAERPGFFPEVHWDPWVEVSPETARHLGMGDDTKVWVVSSRNRYRARLKIFPGTAPENVCAPYGLRHENGELANPLQLLAESRDPFTGLASWFSTFVRLERA